MSTDEQLIERNILKLAPGGMRPIIRGEQRSTTRLGLRRYVLGPGLLVDGHRELRIRITMLELLQLGGLKLHHAVAEGFETVSALNSKIRQFYPGIIRLDEVTHVRFDLVDEEPIEIYRRRHRRRFGGGGF